MNPLPRRIPTALRVPDTQALNASRVYPER